MSRTTARRLAAFVAVLLAVFAPAFPAVHAVARAALGGAAAPAALHLPLLG